MTFLPFDFKSNACYQFRHRGYSYSIFTSEKTLIVLPESLPAQLLLQYGPDLPLFLFCVAECSFLPVSSNSTWHTGQVNLCGALRTVDFNALSFLLRICRFSGASFLKSPSLWSTVSSVVKYLPSLSYTKYFGYETVLSFLVFGSCSTTCLRPSLRTYGPNTLRFS